MAVHNRARERAAALLGVSVDEVAFLPSTSDGVNMVAQTIAFQPGDNVVVETIEFPSDVYPWLLQQQHGVEVRFVGTGFDVPPGALEAAIDARTRAVALSHVSYLTGVRHDLTSVAEAAHAVGAIFIVDASHALGVVPVEARVADFVFSCCYKWQLGCTGIAVGFWNRQLQPDWAPKMAGWMSAKPLDGEGEMRRHEFTPRDDAMRMTLGNPSFPGAYVVDNGFQYLLNVGIEKIEAHVLELTARLREGLAELGLDVLTPAEPSAGPATSASPARTAPASPTCSPSAASLSGKRTAGCATRPTSTTTAQTWTAPSKPPATPSPPSARKLTPSISSFSASPPSPPDRLA